jgi:hypothetical protein
MSQLGFGFDALQDTLVDSLVARTTRTERTASKNHHPSRKAIAQLTLTLHHRPHSLYDVTVRGQMRVEQTLRAILGPRVLVNLTTNRSTMISFNRKRGVLYVRAHAIFADAPQSVLSAMASFVSDGKATSHEARLIDDFIELHRHRIRKTPEKDLIVQPFGEVHDLETSFRRLNESLFEGGIKAAITWSKAARNQRRTSIRMGSYCEEQKLIRIHPALDQTFVPLYFVESVIFHEMLHELYGVDETRDGRRCIHSSEFLQHERLFPEHDAARRWEKKHLTKLLRY